MRIFASSALLGIAIASAQTAAPHRFRFYPNQNITIRSMARGPDGLLWIAASNGVYRFDGFRYEKIESFPQSSARFVAFTSDGSLWVGSYQGLTRLRGGKWEAMSKSDIAGLVVWKDQVLVRVESHIQRFSPDGRQQSFSSRLIRDLSIDSRGKIWSICIHPQSACSTSPANPGSVEQSFTVSGLETYQQSIGGAGGAVWAANDTEAIPLPQRSGGPRRVERSGPQRGRPGPLLPGRGEQIWFLGQVVRGLVEPVQFRPAPDSITDVDAGLEDEQGHVWVAASDRGLFEWTKDPEWLRWYSNDFGDASASQVIADENGTPVLVSDKGLFRLDASRRWQPITKEHPRSYSAVPIGGGELLISVRSLGLFRISGDRTLEHVPVVTADVPEFRRLIRDSHGQIWAGSRRGLFRVDRNGRSLRLTKVELPGVRPEEMGQAVDLEVDRRGRLWVGYVAGVAWLDDSGQWHQLETDRPVRDVRTITASESEIWVAHRHPGFFSRLQPSGSGWKVTQLNAGDGYRPADTDFIKRDSRGWLWRGTSDGVFVSDGVHLAPDDWLHLMPGNALATSETAQYGFTEDSAGNVWISGTEGVTRLRPDRSWFDAPSAAAPRITTTTADIDVFGAVPDVIPANTRRLRFDLGTLDASDFRDRPLRYRLLGLSDKWSVCGGSIEFRGLTNREYVLQLGYAGNGNSAVAAYPFRVGPEPRPAHWSWLGRLLFAFGGAFALVRYLPSLASTRFRIGKAVFLARRRVARRYRNDSAPESSDYSGITLVNRYLLLRAISRGGFSIVYEASDRKFDGKRVALKVIHRNPNIERWIRERFAHEVAALRSIDHPGVVTVMDSWISDAGEPCLVMPLLQGPTLRTALLQSSLELRRVARIAEQLGAALGAIHDRGVVHRDLKPENVILVEYGTASEQAVVIDFGTAGLKGAEQELAVTTIMAGSFYYMAPERLTGHYSPATDVFSLGVMILEMLTGRRLGDLSLMASDKGFEQEVAKSLYSAVGEAAPRVARLLAQAYSADPQARPLGAAAWAAKIAFEIGNR